MTRNSYAMYFTGGHRLAGIAAMFAVALALSVGGPSAAAEGPAPRIIFDNALLNTIYLKDPQEALGLAAEIESYLAANGETGRPAAGGKAPDLKFRGDGGSATHGRDDDIIGRNKKDFDENPVLRNVYYRSPMASLRLLRRFRDAANQIKK